MSTNGTRMSANLIKQRRGKVSTGQLDILLDFLEQHADFATGRITSTFTSQLRDQFWDELALSLNSGDVGPKKEVVKWKKTFSDWKCAVKAKAGRIRGTRRARTNTQNKTVEVLTPQEERLINLVGFAEWGFEDENGQEIDDDDDDEIQEILPSTKEEMNHEDPKHNPTIVLVQCADDNVYKVVETDASNPANSNGEEHSDGVLEENGFATTSETSITQRLEEGTSKAVQNHMVASTNTNRSSNSKAFTFNRNRLFNGNKPYNRSNLPPSNSNAQKQNKLNELSMSLSRMVTAEQRKAAAQERMAAAEERKAAAMESLLAVFTQFLNNQI